MQTIDIAKAFKTNKCNCFSPDVSELSNRRFKKGGRVAKSVQKYYLPGR